VGRPRPSDIPETTEGKSAQAILERNPFDSVTGPFPSKPDLSRHLASA